MRDHDTSQRPRGAARGPTLAAESSHTSRDGAGGLMGEPGMGFGGLPENIRIGEEFIKSVLAMVREECPEDLEFFDQRIEKGLLKKLDHVMESAFEVITYTEAVEILEKSGESFEFPVGWGKDLQSEHERYLTEKKIGRPLFVVDYPTEITAFYLRPNGDGRTVAAVDVRVPGSRGVLWGPLGEERLDYLTANIEERGLPIEEYWWYLDLRRFGSAPHAGFGMGFERLMMYVTGLSNIRDVLPFPRTPGNIAF